MLGAVYLFTVDINKVEGSWEVFGNIGLESRIFPQSPQYPDQFSGAQIAFTVQPEVRFEDTDRERQFVFVPYLMFDNRDSERRHFDFRELYLRRSSSNWDILLGLSQVFWGVAESRHLVDIINQTDLVVNPDEEDKLGQQMVQVTRFNDWGTLTFFILPGMRERTFPGKEGRLRPALPIKNDDPLYESGTKEWHPDFALRYSHYFGAWDVGAYYFYGTGREPTLSPTNDGNALRPFYELIHQVGIDTQYTHGAWLWKVEGLVREGQGRLFAATVAGFEYTLYQIMRSSADLGLLIEYHYDDRNPQEAPVTFFDDATFLGTRLALNDTQDTELLAGIVVNHNDHSATLSLEFERRLGQAWQLEVESFLFAEAEGDSPLQDFKRDSFATFRLSYFF